MDGRTAALVLVLFALFFALLTPQAHAGVCVLPSQVDCINETYKLSTGVAVNTGYDGTANMCTGQQSGLYDATPNVLQVNACELGCCCGTTSNAIIIKQTYCASGFKPFVAGDTTCQATCNIAPPTTLPQCGEGTITADEVGVCACGATDAASGNVGQYCCWNQQLKTSQNLCTAPPSNLCAPNAPITSACNCGGQDRTGGVCCAGGIWHQDALDASVCTTTTTNPAQCGNNRLDTGEICDARYEYRFSSPAGWYNTSGVGCTANGAADPNSYCTASCTCATTATPNSCGNGVCESPSETTTSCSVDCRTQSICNPYPSPASFDATYDAATGNVLLTWAPPAGAGCNVYNYVLERRMHNDTTLPANVQPDKVVQLQATATSYTDATLPLTHKRAHYRIVAYFVSGTNTVTTHADKALLVPTPDCPTANANYCASATKAVRCSGYDPVIDICNTNADEVCKKEGGVADCYQLATNCKECNGLFGMFPDDDHEVMEQGAEVACSLAAACYKDLGTTNVEIYKACKDIDSCTGYLTEDACGTDECGRGACEWVQLASQPWRGVCRATNAQLQHCSDCNALGGVGCTAEICSAIGNQACVYYGGNGSRTYSGINPGCYEKEELPCELFTTRTMCEGLEPDGASFNLNVQYTGTSRTGGTHVPTNVSNDIAGHGKCVWNASNSVCYRDADKNMVPDDDEKPLSVTNRIAYLLDFTDPISSVTIAANQVYAKEFRAKFTSQAAFYVNFSQGTQTCYPRWTGTSIVSGDEVHRTFTTADTGNWNICFYSMDTSRNLEPVHIIPFQVDAQPPTIANMSAFTSIIPYSNGGFRTHVRVFFNTTQNSTCIISLRNSTGPVRAQDGGFGTASTVTVFGMRFGVTYPQLTDDMHTTTAVCTDTAGNNATQTIDFRTDSNLLITEPLPKNWSTIYKTDVTIGIQTDRNAQCRYGARGTNFSDMAPYTTTGATTHAAVFPVTAGATGTYLLQSACRFIDTNLVVYGDPVDDIKFSIDLLPPETVLCNANTTSASMNMCNTANRFLNRNAESQAIALRCQDAPSTNSYGCEYKDIRYCITTDINDDCTPAANPLGTPVININGTQPFILHFQSVDKGGNVQPKQTVTINLMDLTRPQVIPDFQLDLP